RQLRIFTFAATKCSRATAPSFSTSCSSSMTSISPQRSRATTRVLDIRVLVAPVFFSDSGGWADGYLGHLHKCSHWERVCAFRKARGLSCRSTTVWLIFLERLRHRLIPI